MGPAGVRGAGQGTSAAAKIVSRGEGHTLEGRRLSCRLSLRGRGLVLVVRPRVGIVGDVDLGLRGPGHGYATLDLVVFVASMTA